MQHDPQFPKPAQQPDDAFSTSPRPAPHQPHAAPLRTPPMLDVAQESWFPFRIASGGFILAALLGVVLFLLWYIVNTGNRGKEALHKLRVKQRDLLQPLGGKEPDGLGARDLVGQWRKEQNGVPSEIDLQANGDFEWRVAEMNAKLVIYTGKWTLFDKKLHLNVLDMNRDGLLQNEDEDIDFIDANAYRATNRRTKEKVSAERIR